MLLTKTRGRLVFAFLSSAVLMLSYFSFMLPAGTVAAAPNYAVSWNGGDFTASSNTPGVTASQISTALKSGAKWINNQEIDLSLGGQTIKFTDSSPCSTTGSSGCQFNPQGYGCTGSSSDGNSPATYMDIQLGSQGHTDLILAAVKAGGPANQCQAVVTATINNDELPLSISNASASTTTPASDGSSTANSSSAGAATCESSGFTLNWVFCAIYDGLSHISSWLLDNVVDKLLSTSPVCLSNSGQGCTGKNADITFKIWSNFRIYGDVFLIIVLLVVVFGEALGGGLIEAYTVKKVLPRLLAAAILINLSIYIVAFLVDVTNIIGGGVGELVTAPLKGAGAFSIHPSGITAPVLGGAGIFALVAGAGSVAALFTLDGGALILVGLVLPAFLAILSVLFTIMIRKIIITALIYVSPIAFALWCLPNTEKYFKQWWDKLFEMLIIYPIIVLMFAICDVLSVTADSSGSSILGFIMSFLFLVIPLILIPYAFRLAGQSISRIHEGVTGVRQRVHNSQGMKERRERAKEHYGRRQLQNRMNLHDTFQNQAKGGAVRRRVFRTAAGMYGGYNVQAEASARRAAVAREINEQIATGDDSEIRALSVNKRTSKSRIGDNGQRQFQTLGGTWVDESAVDSAYHRWGRDHFAQQASLAYEMRKASTEGEVQGVAENYQSVADAWGMNAGERASAWKGAAFEHQNEHLEFKNMKATQRTMANGQSKSVMAMDDAGYDKFISEIYEKRGSYPMAQMGANTFKELGDAHDHFTQQAAQATTQADRDKYNQQASKVAAIAETFVNRYGGRGGSVAGMEGDQPLYTPPVPPTVVAPTGPQTASQSQAGAQLGAQYQGGDYEARLRAAQQGAGTGSMVSTNAAGAAHVAERVRELAVKTGIYQEPPTTPPGSAPGTFPPIPPQN